MTGDNLLCWTGGGPSPIGETRTMDSIFAFSSSGGRVVSLLINFRMYEQEIHFMIEDVETFVNLFEES